MLLILDNCEHVIESAATFAHRVLGECRRLRILATSREPLGITGEALWPVAPLVLPAEDADPGEIESAPAVRLLRDRAGAVRKDLATDAAHVVDDGARLPGAGRDAAGDRARRGQVAHHVPRPARQSARRPVPPADRRQPYRAAAAPDAARGGRLELGAAHRRRTDGPAQALGVLRWGEPGSGRAGLRGRCGRVGGGARAAHRADREVAAGRRGRRRAALPDARHDQGVRRAAARGGGRDRTWRAVRISPTSPSSPRPRSRTCAAPSSWNGSPRSRSSTTTSLPRCAVRSRPARRHGAMRLAAAAGWYWWLGGHKAEGNELIMAATAMPGEVADEIRAMVYAFVMGFVTSGRGRDQHQAAEWIHKAYAAQPAGPEPSPGGGARRRAGTHVAGAGRVPARVGTAARPTRTPGYARWPGCSSARCGSCSATAGGTRTRISRRRSPSSGRSANGGGSRSP